jgi:uncharacterized membrane protein
MRTRRQILLGWVEHGLIAPENLQRALAVAEVFPSAADWRRFLNNLLLWLGALMIAAGVIYFFAYNWNDLGRTARFGIVEALIAATLIVLWRIGLDGIAGKTTLLVAALFVGALLALVGQTYQTGADTFELFAAWAALILPWVLAGRFAVLWLLWLALLNLAAWFYYLAFGGLFGFVFAPWRLMWVLFGLNAAALAVWEALATRAAQERWALRVLATASAAFATALALYAVVDLARGDAPSIIAWLGFLGVAYVVYRYVVLDVYVLALEVLSIIVVVATWLTVHAVRSSDAAGALLLIALAVIGLSAAGGWYLKQVVNEARP